MDDFSEALKAIRRGMKMCRLEWQYGMYVVLNDDKRSILLNSPACTSDWDPTMPDVLTCDWVNYDELFDTNKKIEEELNFLKTLKKRVEIKKGKIMDNLNFGQALEEVKKGEKVYRKRWNGKGMWISLIPAENGLDKMAYLQMKTVDNLYVPWLASQTDVLAEDWCIVI